MFCVPIVTHKSVFSSAFLMTTNCKPQEKEPPQQEACGCNFILSQHDRDLLCTTHLAGVDRTWSCRLTASSRNTCRSFPTAGNSRGTALCRSSSWTARAGPCSGALGQATPRWARRASNYPGCCSSTSVQRLGCYKRPKWRPVYTCDFPMRFCVQKLPQPTPHGVLVATKYSQVSGNWKGGCLQIICDKFLFNPMWCFAIKAIVQGEVKRVLYAKSHLKSHV